MSENAPPEPVEYQGSRGAKLDLLRMLIQGEDPADWIEKRRQEKWQRPNPATDGEYITGGMSYALIAEEINEIYRKAKLPTTVTYETVRRWHAGE